MISLHFQVLISFIEVALCKDDTVWDTRNVISELHA